jgi:hypothetical protein
MLVQNGGFNCVAARAIVTHRSWTRRRALIDAVRDSLRRAEERVPYYPGAVDRWRAFTDAHKEAEWFGEDAAGCVPFTLIPDLDPASEDEIAFTTEAFCGVIGEVGLDAPRSVVEYIEQAVAFCNDKLWGTLSATIIVHPRSLKDPLVADAVERAIDDLRYGSVVVNHWSAVPYGMVSTTWDRCGPQHLPARGRREVGGPWPLPVAAHAGLVPHQPAGAPPRTGLRRVHRHPRPADRATAAVGCRTGLTAAGRQRRSSSSHRPGSSASSASQDCR